MQRPEKGFTLTELLTTLTISTLLITLLLPEVQKLLAHWQLSSLQHQLHASLNLARAAAISKGSPVIVRSIGDNWNNGWVVFVDRNNNTRLDGGEPQLFQLDELPAGIRLQSNFGNYARYRSSGRSAYASGAFMAGTWYFCADSLPQVGRKLVMSLGGRVRDSDQVDSFCAG